MLDRSFLCHGSIFLAIYFWLDELFLSLASRTVQVGTVDPSILFRVSMNHGQSLLGSPSFQRVVEWVGTCRREIEFVAPKLENRFRNRPWKSFP